MSNRPDAILPSGGEYLLRVSGIAVSQHKTIDEAWGQYLLGKRVYEYPPAAASLLQIDESTGYMNLHDALASAMAMMQEEGRGRISIFDKFHPWVEFREQWAQKQAQAYRVLKRLKPELTFDVDEIASVGEADGGNSITIRVDNLSPESYKVSREKWEQ